MAPVSRQREVSRLRSRARPVRRDFASARSSHGCARRYSKTSRASIRGTAASSSRPCPASHSPCSRRATARWNGSSSRRSPLAAATKSTSRGRRIAGETRTEATCRCVEEGRPQPDGKTIHEPHQLFRPVYPAKCQRRLEPMADVAVLDVLRSNPQLVAGGDQTALGRRKCLLGASLGQAHGRSPSAVSGERLDFARALQACEPGKELACRRELAPVQVDLENSAEDARDVRAPQAFCPEGRRDGREPRPTRPSAKYIGPS